MKALAPPTQKIMLQRAHTVLEGGLSPIVRQIVNSALSKHTKETSPLSAALVRSLVLATKPEAYAAACQALASAVDPDYSKIEASTLVISGEEDYMSNKETTKFFQDKVKNVKVVEMRDVGHWHSVEQPIELRKVLEDFFL